jgi:hypothetical protein
LCRIQHLFLAAMWIFLIGQAMDTAMVKITDQKHADITVAIAQTTLNSWNHRSSLWYNQYDKKRKTYILYYTYFAAFTDFTRKTVGWEI